MPSRFYAPDLDTAAGSARLPEDEAAHLTRVLRLGIGADVCVFDGRGGEWRAVVRHAGRDGVELQLGMPVTPAPERRVFVTLVLTVLKGDHMDVVVRDAVALGVGAIQPVVSERAEVGLVRLLRSRRAERWQRIAIASAKQCGRAVVPDVATPVGFEAWLASPGNAVRYLLAEPTVDTPVTKVQDLPPPTAAAVLTGPEGGWTPTEVTAACAAGARPVRLGRRTLRAETAPLVALAALGVVWDDL